MLLWRCHRRHFPTRVTVRARQILRSTPNPPLVHAHRGNSSMSDTKLDLLQGTLDIMVLQTLDVLGSLHGYGIARRIEQLSGNEILLNQGTIYASLVRLQQRGWIAAKWGVSESNRKAKFYSITKSGRSRIKKDRTQWERVAAVMARVLSLGTRS